MLLRMLDERVVLAVVASMALAVAVWHLVGMRSWMDQFTSTPSRSQAPQILYPSFSKAPLTIGTELLHREVIWKNDVPLFQSVSVMERNGKMFPLDMSDPDPVRPPFTNQWLVRHQLNFLDGKMAIADPDDDGFTNLEEFEGNTDPRDGQSHPSRLLKVRYLGRQAEITRLKYGLTANGRHQFSLQTKAHPPNSDWCEPGDRFGVNERFELLGVRDEPERPLTFGPLPTRIATVKDRRSGRELELPVHLVVDWTDWNVRLSDELNSARGEFLVGEHREFRLEEGIAETFRVIRAEREAVVIQSSEQESPLIISLTGG